MSDSLDRLEKKLNSVTNNAHIERTEFGGRGMDAPTAWSKDPMGMVKRVKGMKPLELFFTGSVVFFAIAIIAAVFIFFVGNNTVSTKNVDIAITGPSEIGAGSTLSFQVVVTNKNAVPMQLTDLLIEFPDGTRSADNISQDLPRLRLSLGTIEPGQSVNRTVRAVLFGLQGTDLSIKASAEYHIPSSNAVFVSDSDHTIRINEAPAAISVQADTEAVSGTATTMTITVTSNAPDVLKNMLLAATYPPGYTFKSSSPAPAATQNTWELGDIEPGGKRTVTITGVFAGEDGESKVLHFVAGNKQDNAEAVAAPLATSDLSLTVAKPFVAVDLLLNGEESGTHTIERGKPVSGTIRWQNNLPVRIQNFTIVLSLQGSVLDKSSVRVSQGFYNSNTNTITWDKSTLPSFADVESGASGQIDFAFAALPSNMGTFKNPAVTLSVNTNAQRLSETNVPQSIQSSATTKAQVATSLIFNAGLIATNGPARPVVGTKTTYSVTWVANNTGNAVANAEVTASLPPYVDFISGGQNVSYDSTARKVTWSPGDIADNASANGVFQVTFTPSVSQVGTQPVIVSSQNLSAEDRFTLSDIEESALDLTTTSANGSNGGSVTQ